MSTVKELNIYKIVIGLRVIIHSATILNHSNNDDELWVVGVHSMKPPGEIKPDYSGPNMELSLIEN